MTKLLEESGEWVRDKVLYERASAWPFVAMVVAFIGAHMFMGYHELDVHGLEDLAWLALGYSGARTVRPWLSRIVGTTTNWLGRK